MKLIVILVSASLVIIVAGCQLASTGSAVATCRQGHAECLVCKSNADLACVDIAVEDATPSYAYGGTTYYFCSETCKKKFAMDPQEYLAEAAK